MEQMKELAKKYHLNTNIYQFTKTETFPILTYLNNVFFDNMSKDLFAF